MTFDHSVTKKGHVCYAFVLALTVVNCLPIGLQQLGLGKRLRGGKLVVCFLE